MTSALLAFVVTSCNESDEVTTSLAKVNTFTYEVLNTFPHDVDAFTQGLVYDDGYMYEGTGLYGYSSLRKVDLDTGNILMMRELSDMYFGEGITIFEDKIFQLTWQSNIGFIYSKKLFEPFGEFSYPTQGWGITHDNQHLIMSDGSAILHFLDPKTQKEINSIQVLDNGIPVARLNELEFVQEKIYANVWQTNYIVIIEPTTGQVISRINLENILEPYDHQNTIDVLNGIAYDAEGDRLFITGKLWPKIFEIRLVPLN